jgi:hypothetical protein
MRGLRLVGALLGLGLVAGVPVRSAEAGLAGPGVVQGKPGKVALSRLLEAASSQSGIQILLDPALAKIEVQAPEADWSDATIGANLEAIRAQLPKGSLWACLVLPSRDKPYRFDDGFQLLGVQNAAFGMKGELSDKHVEILGRRIPIEEAGPLVKMLDLRPVFVVMSKVPRPGGNEPGSVAFKDSVDATIRRIGELDAPTRNAVIKSTFNSLKGYIGGLKGEERRAILESIGKEFGGPFVGWIFGGTPPAKP